MTDKPKATKKINFRYLKASNYRSFHVDGIYGGLTGKGLLHMDFYLEKPCVPETEIYSVVPDGLNFESREGPHGEVIREIEGGLIMDYNMMVATKEWLNTKIKDYENSFLTKKNSKEKS
jgi:hypothetical protein